jgi:dethiobiotin synthetase
VRKKPLFITGIGTGVGKTVASAVIVEALQADYWKPVQSGDLHETDTHRVKSLVSNKQSVFHPEAYQLTQPFSPHKSAALDNLLISLNAIELPVTSNRLVIEGAGGLMVPLNDTDLIIDLIKKFDAEVTLVSQNYLGSINHTLLSIHLLQSHGLRLKQIIITGQRDKDSEGVIEKHFGSPLLHIPLLDPLDRETLSTFAKGFQSCLQ